jgi:hypothetical protein
MRPLVAFDESGNSGPQLLDPEQPIFALASVFLSDEEARAVLPGRDREYKFGQLKRSAPGQATILAALNSPLLSAEACLLSAVHKRFMALTKIVDLLVEPLVHRHGVDLYARGANIALSNMWYVVFQTFLGAKAVDELLIRFVEMVRSPTARTIDRFYRLAETAFRKHKREETVSSELAVLLATRPLAEACLDEWDGSALDPAIPAFVEHASIWTGRLQRPFSIVHDTSKPLLNEQIILEAMMSETEERRQIGYDRRTMQFPISARGITFRDSRECLPLQVADLLASATAYCLKLLMRRQKNDFATSLLQTHAMTHPFRPLWPEAKVTPEELDTTATGGIDPNEYVGDYVAKRLGGIPPRGQRRKT